MFERYTDRSRRVLVLANEEARFRETNTIDTPEILLGLVHEGDGVAAKALERFGIGLDDLRLVVQGRWPSPGKSENLPGQFSPEAKRILEYALREALILGHNYIGTEHLLLSMLRANDEKFNRILLSYPEASSPKIRSEVMRLIGVPADRAEQAGEADRLRQDIRDLMAENERLRQAMQSAFEILYKELHR